ncbi:MAG: RecQ family ATP-dependent DNA helicase [Ignavibacteria bacterium]|nr:RecQ family ATP-dependent DNA helicase [Ignavibacteria bacterium]
MNIFEALNKYFGYKSFRSGQEEIIESIISGENVLAILPTGGGKSLCYQIPAIIGNSYSIVISPLIALMKDQVDSLNQIEEIAAFINSSVGFRETEKVLRNISEGKTKLLYLAPERLGNIKITALLKELKPDYIFVDEAHCISEWGHNFRPSYRKIKEFCDFTGVSKISGFTATATPEVRQDIIKQLGFISSKIFIKGFERENLSIGAVRTSQKKEKCLSLLKQFGHPAIVYCSTRKNAEEAVSFLLANKINAAFYHAGMTPENRRIVQDDFLNDRIDVICSTNAFGMGIDKKDIRLIIHFNMPSTIENYYQEIGRAGRDGNESKAILLFEPRDKNIQEFLIRNSYPELEQIKSVYSLLCNYGQIALGEVNTVPVPADDKFTRICDANGISSQILNSCLNFMVNAGIFTRISEFEQNHHIKINLGQSELKSYIKSVASAFFSDLLVFLLKKYGSSIFRNSQRINLKDISSFFDTEQDEIISALTTLSGAGILDYQRPSDSPSYTLKEPRVEIKRLQIDLSKMNEHKQYSLNKLQEIERYVFSKNCRFKFILDYFGEETESYKCGKCDNCADFLNTDPELEEYINEKIINTLKFLTEENTEKTIEDILWGNDSKYSSMATFGAFSNLNKRILKDALANLFSRKIIGKTKNKFFIPGEKLKENTSSAINTYDLALFNKLKDIRDAASQKFMQSPGLICSDELLRIISSQKPNTQSALLTVKGFNQRMFNKLGDDILEVVKEHSVKEVINLPDSLELTKNLINKKYNLKDIASLLKVTEAVAGLQIETIIQYLPETDITKIIDKEKIRLIIKEVNNNNTVLKEIKEKLQEKVTYPEIRIVVAKINAQKNRPSL